MSCSSRRDARLLQRFIQAQWFRHPQTGKIYFYVLRHFQRFVAQCGQGEPPSVSVLQQWLRNRSLKWPAHMVFHHARLVERFLDWSYPGAANPHNPFAELHRLWIGNDTYCARTIE
jgi:integrase/recombinase XerD